jgi:hypothetical protein
MKEGRKTSQQAKDLYQPGLLVNTRQRRLGTARLCNSDKRHGVVMTVNGEYISSECSVPERLIHADTECSETGFSSTEYMRRILYMAWLEQIIQW